MRILWKMCFVLLVAGGLCVFGCQSQQQTRGDQQVSTSATMRSTSNCESQAMKIDGTDNAYIGNGIFGEPFP